MAVVYQGIEMIFRIGLAILKLAEPDLMSLDMEGMITVSDSLLSWEMLTEKCTLGLITYTDIQFNIHV